MTVYVPAAETLMDEVFAPVFHNNVPAELVDKVELPQLLTTVTVGVAGIDFGAATPLPKALVHPFIVVVTE